MKSIRLKEFNKNILKEPYKMDVAMKRTTKMYQKLLVVTLLLCLSFFFYGCQSKNNPTQDPNSTIVESKDNDAANNPSSIEDPKNATEENIEEKIVLSDSQLRELAVNELGQVMVLMYHIIGDKEDEWERTKDNFRNDLKVLYDEGYYLVTARDFVTGNMDVPAGKTPVVLTFDDATEGHFRFIEKDNGELIVDPDSAVGIIENFAKDHPDFGTAASFYVYYPVPFRQNDRPEWRQLKFEYLTELGMEIGNHTYGHEFLNRLTDDEVQKTLVRNILATQKLLPGYQVDTFALTYGIYPKNKELAVKGSYDGTEYYHKGVFLVGSHPSHSPFSIEFDASAIPRIRAASVPSDFFNQWIDHFRKYPERRFVSDGDSSTITVPKELADKINPERLGDRTTRVYE